MIMTVEGLSRAGPAILIVAKTPNPGSATTAANAILGEVMQDPLQTKGENAASRVLFHVLTNHDAGPKDYSWLLALADHERFTECLSGGVIMAEETGTQCKVVGTRDGGVARDVVREIESYLEQNT